MDALVGAGVVEEEEIESPSQSLQTQNLKTPFLFFPMRHSKDSSNALAVA